MRLFSWAAVGSVVLLSGLLGMPARAAAEPVGPFGEQDWPAWRGPTGDGIAPPQPAPPLTWTETENVAWKSEIPGRGHGSPIVVGERVCLATADEAAGTRSLLALDRATGKTVWTKVVHAAGRTPFKNSRGTDASSTPACDGRRLFVNFLHDDAMVTSAVSLDGDVLWQTRVADYVVHQGYGSSPTVFESLVLVAADNKSGGAVAGLDRVTGAIVWRQERPKTPNYPSPVVLRLAGRPQLVMTGCDLVASYDPRTGNKLWEFAGATTECVTSTVTDGQLFVSSGGYPKNHVAAYRGDGSGTKVWENGTRVYVPSMLSHDGYLYAVADAGVAVCWKFATGEEQWKERLGGGFSSSPVLVGDRIYATDEAGKATVYRASPKGLEILGGGQLGQECFATPTIVGGRIYLRIALLAAGQRREVLYCLGKS